METKIVAIGNSRGVRLPKQVLRDAQLDPSRPVRISARPRAILIEQAADDPRAGWEDSFRARRARKPEDLWGDLPPGEGWER
ncbi:MAG: AbrB/MazE/SpoVT family DNA-binding domain-containing protein [Betaproteobacteria bacterium]